MSLFVQYMHGAGLVSAEETRTVQSICGDELEHGGVGPGASGFSRDCLVALSVFTKAIGDYNIYHLGSPCPPGETGNWGDGTAYSCGSGDALTQYLNVAKIRETIHATGVDSLKWQMWDGDW